MNDSAPTIWSRWWVRTALAVLMTIVAWVTQVQLGAQLGALAYYALLVFGATSAGLAFLLPVRHARQQELRRISAMETAENAIEDHRLRTSDILEPICHALNEIAAAPDAASRSSLSQRFLQIVVDFAPAHNNEARVRGCFFEYQPGPPWIFQCTSSSGRSSRPRGGFEAGTARGRAVMKLVEDGRPCLVRDSDKEDSVARLVAGEGYRSFICAPVVTGDRIHGLLTIDCRNPDELDEGDRRFVALLALLLAAGLEMSIPAQSA